MLDSVFPKIHREGYKFLGIFVLVTFGLFFLSNFLGSIGAILCVWCYYFFRDPERYSIEDQSYLVSPADGLITDVSEIPGPKELGLEKKKFKRISIFMNVFNCHVNRVPLEGEIKKIAYVPGKFLNASLDKASVHNERNLLHYQDAEENEYVVVQIAGLIARRILCEVEEGQKMKQGERFGMIRFGSRVDLYVDPKVEILAREGQNVVAGESLLVKR